MLELSALAYQPVDCWGEALRPNLGRAFAEVRESDAALLLWQTLRPKDVELPLLGRSVVDGAFLRAWVPREDVDVRRSAWAVDPLVVEGPIALAWSDIEARRSRAEVLALVPGLARG